MKLVLSMLLSSVMFAGQSWSMHVGALRKAVLFVLDGKECEDDALVSLNLLLQAGYDKSKQEELLGKLGASFNLIESVLGTLTKFRGIVSKENTGNLNKLFLSSSLHAFPSHVHPGGVAVVSSTLSNKHDITSIL